MQSSHLKPAIRRDLNAFTLVEMLVVIAIISVLMTAGSIGLSGIGGKGVTSGVATAESLFDEARTTAVGRNLRACVLVAKELDNNKAENLRRIVVAYEDVDAQGNPKASSSQDPNWVLASRGAVLPEQIFFSDKFSKQKDGGKIPEVAAGKLRSAPTSDKAVTAAYKGTYYIYEFNSQGISSKTPGASFIIGSGARNTTKTTAAAPPKITAAAKRDFGGFVVWRNGRTSLFRSPDQMSLGDLTPGASF